VNALVRGSRKSTANCDTHCDVQHSENDENLERDSYKEITSLCTRIVVVEGVRGAPVVRSMWGAAYCKLCGSRDVTAVTEVYTPLLTESPGPPIQLLGCRVSASAEDAWQLVSQSCEDQSDFGQANPLNLSI